VISNCYQNNHLAILGPRPSLPKISLEIRLSFGGISANRQTDKRNTSSSSSLSVISDLVVTITTTITKSNCSSFTLTITITKSTNNTKTILKLNQNTENYIKTVTKTMLKLKRFYMLSCLPSRLKYTTLV